jgi:hypothetical protein
MKKKLDSSSADENSYLSRSESALRGDSKACTNHQSFSSLPIPDSKPLELRVTVRDETKKFSVYFDLAEIPKETFLHDTVEVTYDGRLVHRASTERPKENADGSLKISRQITTASDSSIPVNLRVGQT